MADAGPSNAENAVEVVDSEREERLLAKLPVNEGSELKKDQIECKTTCHAGLERCVSVIMRTERALSRNFLFAVNRGGKGNFVRLHYNVRGDKASALQSAPCKFVRCQDCGDLLYFEGGQLASVRF